MRIQNLVLSMLTVGTLLQTSSVHAMSIAHSLSSASPTPTPAAISTSSPTATTPASTDFCSEWFQQKATGALDGITIPQNSLAVVIQALKIRFFPAAYSEPEFTPVLTTTRVNPASVPTTGTSKNVVFFVGAPPEVLASETAQAANAKLKQMQKQVHPLLSDILKLTKTADVASCIALEKQMNFNYDSYTNLVDENGNLRNDQQIANQSSSLNDLKSAIKASHLGWETRDYTDLNEVYVALQDPQIENVVIVSHGQTNSLIVDSRWNEVPQYFFHDIAPHLRSLSFYSCYSKTVPAEYGLPDLFAKAPSIYQNRLITTVQSNPKVYEAGMAPLNGFKHYLEGLEQKIMQMRTAEAAVASSTAALPAYVQPTDCSVQIQAPVVTSGAYGFFLNLKYIGTIEATTPSGQAVTLHFPCSLIGLPRNILTNRNINTTVLYGEITGKPFEITQWTDPSGSKVVQTNQYQTSTGAYQSSKWEIDVAQ